MFQSIVFWLIIILWFQNINGPNASDQNIYKINNVQNFGLLTFGRLRFWKFKQKLTKSIFGWCSFLNIIWVDRHLIKNNFGWASFGLLNLGWLLFWSSGFLSSSTDPSKVTWKSFDWSDITYSFYFCSTSIKICYVKIVSYSY